ncbi:MAG: sugar transferase [Clostridia bacterium]|nr:sugar transferase [Clostridia bacterium]
MYKHFFKRLFDIAVGLLGLIPFSIFFLIFAPIIWLTDRGPVFYNAPRLGKNGKVFKMYKFRSMKVNSPNLRNADGSTYNGANDPRVTKVGRFMRKTSIDEFPQFLNVLFGHMSLIGPRAHLTTSYTGFENLDEKRQKRLQVRPGITGYSQAYYRNSIGSEQKLENDVYYVEHLSFWLDVKIFFKTVFSVLKRENIYVAQPTEAAPTETAEEKQPAEVGKQ